MRLERAADAVRLEEEYRVVVHHGRDLLHAVALAQPRAGHAAPAAVLRAPPRRALRHAPRRRGPASWRFHRMSSAPRACCCITNHHKASEVRHLWLLALFKPQIPPYSLLCAGVHSSVFRTMWSEHTHLWHAMLGTQLSISHTWPRQVRNEASDEAPAARTGRRACASGTRAG